jgi:hypothetical protein
MGGERTGSPPNDPRAILFLRKGEHMLSEDAKAIVASNLTLTSVLINVARKAKLEDPEPYSTPAEMAMNLFKVLLSDPRFEDLIK